MCLIMLCYSNIYVNDKLIKLNKFVSWITNKFCDLFFLVSNTPVRHLHVPSDVTPKILHPKFNQGLTTLSM